MPLSGIIAAKINSCMAQYMSGAQKEQEYQRSETTASRQSSRPRLQEQTD